MIRKLVLLCLLAAAPALGSSIKGYRADESKGGRLLAPVEQQRLVEQHQAAKSAQIKLESSLDRKEEVQQQREEQLPVQAEQRIEELSQQREQEPLPVHKLEEAPPAKTLRYEARPQIRDELPLAKGQRAPPAEPQRQEEAPGKGTRVTEQRAVIEEKIEQVQREAYDYGQQQQVEAREEQRREENIQQQQQQVQIGEELHQAPIKGAGAPLVAPLGQAEPYAFEYAVEGSSRRESGDSNGVVRGQYTLQGADGSGRIVDYVADANGFRASVNTNEFGTEARSPAGVALRSSQPAAEEISLRLEGKTREFLAPAIKGPSRPGNWNVKAPPPLVAQAQVPIVEEPRATKGAREEPLATKGAREEPLAAKGQRLEAVELERPQQQVELVQASGEARAPKSISAELTRPALLHTRAGFESATSHRPVERRPVYVGPPVPVRPVVPSVRSHLVPVAGHPVRVAPVAPVVRARGERYPPSPVQGYRRVHSAVQDEPRFALYSSADDESLVSSFDRS